MKKIIIILVLSHTASILSAQNIQEIPSLFSLCLNYIITQLQTTNSKIINTDSYLPENLWEDVKGKALYNFYRADSLPQVSHTSDHRSFCTVYESGTHNKMAVISPTRAYMTTVNNIDIQNKYILITNVQTQKLIRQINMYNNEILNLKFYKDDALLCFYRSNVPYASPVYMMATLLQSGPLPSPDATCFELQSSTLPANCSLPSRNLLFLTQPFNKFSNEHFIIATLDLNLKKIISKMHKHTEHINALASNESIPFLASASDDKTVCIWEPDKKNHPNYAPWEKVICTAVLPHDYPVKTVCSSPDGIYIISGTYNHNIQFYLWHVATRSCIFKFPLFQQVLKRLPMYCSWSSDNASILLYGENFFYETTPQKLLTIVAYNALFEKKALNKDKKPITTISRNDNNTALPAVHLNPEATNNNNNNSTGTPTAVSRMASY